MYAHVARVELEVFAKKSTNETEGGERNFRSKVINIEPWKNPQNIFGQIWQKMAPKNKMIVLLRESGLRVIVVKMSNLPRNGIFLPAAQRLGQVEVFRCSYCWQDVWLKIGTLAFWFMVAPLPF